MDRYNTSTSPIYGQGNSYTFIEEILESLDDSELLNRLWKLRRNGRPGHPIKAMWSAYVASYLLSMTSTNDLIRRLQDDPQLREVCGFEDVLPHRTTFNRFITRLTNHLDAVEACFATLTDELKELLPDLGNEVAIDSTAVKTHSNPNRKTISDPEAARGVKHKARAKSKDQTEYFFGYKVHAIADANHGIPLGQIITASNRNDSPELPNVIEYTKNLYDWFQPQVAIADRGYDAMSNHRYLIDQGITPIIHIRNTTAEDKLYNGIFTKEGVPTCMGNIPMEYVSSSAEGHQYQCQGEGCHLKNSTNGGILHCDTVYTVTPSENPRLSGPIRRASDEWKAYDVKRQSIERVFKSEKQSRRLEHHYIRGMAKITLHAIMSTLTFQATALHKIENGQIEDMRWMVRKVA